MRRRLLFSTLAVAVTAVLLFGVPLAFVLQQLQVTVAQDQVQRTVPGKASKIARLHLGSATSVTPSTSAAVRPS